MDKIVEILKLKYRSKSDIEILLSLLNQVNFFKSSKITSKELIFICKKLRHLQVPAGEDVITYGEVGTEFFITLQGKTEVLIPKTPEEVEKEGK